jgi:HEAT repeat protein
MPDNNNISTRFIEVINALIASGKVANKKAFATAVGCSTSMITEIAKGRSNVGVSALQNTVLQYCVDATWLLTGQGEMFAVEAQTAGDPAADHLLMMMIEKKDAVIQQQAEELGQLREQVVQLRRRLEKTVTDADMQATANVG